MELLKTILEDYAVKHYWKPVEYKYKKPAYDPFEVFKPSKAFLQEVVKQLKHQAHGLLPDQHKLKHEHGFNEILRPQLQINHTKVCRRIKDYEYRISTNRTQDSQSDGITSIEILRAKQSSIQDYYTGTLRKAGKTLSGLCPFHEEKHGSFCIYMDSNRFVCFGCQAKGDVIDFVQKSINLKFFEAVKFILKI